MPELCRFDGMRITIVWFDHNPPHFHAEYSGTEVEVDIRTATLGEGWLPPRLRRRLLIWTREHQSELMDAWDKVSAGEMPSKIAPPMR